jgi:hypothetical protein
MTHYRQQAKARFTCPVLVPFEHKTSKSERCKQRKKNYGKITEISASLASNPASEANINFETKKSLHPSGIFNHPQALQVTHHILHINRIRVNVSD